MEKINGLQMINDLGFGVGKCGEKNLPSHSKKVSLHRLFCLNGVHLKIICC